MFLISLAWLGYGPVATVIDRKRPRTKPQGILLTFDDGPDPRYTPELLDVLDWYQVKAIFFCLSQQVRRYPELTHEIIRRGHQVGLHGASHVNAWTASPKQVEKNIRLGYRQMVKRGFTPVWYRPPYGRINAWDHHSMATLYWTSLFHDWDIDDDDKLLERLKQRSKPGEIFLLHDGSQGRAKPGMPRRMIRVLGDWFDWAKQQAIVIEDGNQWRPHE